MKYTPEQFTMPRYREIPNIGLFLEQTVKYINVTLSALGCMEITSSMISNYVKKGYIKRPIRKQYDAEQIAKLIFITVAKSALVMEHIKRLMDKLDEEMTFERAYNYFSGQLEEAVYEHFGIQREETGEESDIEEADSVRMMKSVISAAGNIIYLHSCFAEYESEKYSDYIKRCDT